MLFVYVTHQHMFDAVHYIAFWNSQVIASVFWRIATLGAIVQTGHVRFRVYFCHVSEILCSGYSSNYLFFVTYVRTDTRDVCEDGHSWRFWGRTLVTFVRTDTRGVCKDGHSQTLFSNFRLFHGIHTGSLSTGMDDVCARFLRVPCVCNGCRDVAGRALCDPLTSWLDLFISWRDAAGTYKWLCSRLSMP